MIIHIAMLEDNKAEASATMEMVDRYFKGSENEYTLKVFSSSKELLEQSISKFDLLLLDILLEGEEINGMDIAKKIRESNPKVAIVFLTKSTHFAIEGYKVNAIDYIVKPIVYEEFLLKMHKILDIMAHSLDREIIMKTVDGVIKTKESNILYVEVIRHYLHFHTKEGEILVVRGSMKDYSEELSSVFARSGNSFIVNLRYVEKIAKADIFLSGKDGELISVPLTRSFRESFLNAFSTYSGT